MNSPNSDSWRLEKRYAEGGSWHVVDRTGGEEGARENVLSPRFECTTGDLVRLVGPTGEVVGVWVQTSRNLVDVGEVPPELGRGGWDWETAWSRPDAYAEAMLRAAVQVDRRRLASVAIACAELALEQRPARDDLARQALRTATRWVGGGASTDEVRDYARVAAAAAAVSAAAAAAVDAAAAVVDAADPTAAVDAATGAVAAALTVASGVASGDANAIAGARRALAALVRRDIPLSELLLARAGDPTPPLRP